MNTLVLLVESGSAAWSPDVWAIRHGGEYGADGQVIIEGETGWLSVVRDDQLLEDFDAVERSRLVEFVVAPVAYLIEWKGRELVERFLRSIPAETRAAVDNDHGLLVDVHEIADKPLESWVTVSRLR